MAPSGKATAAGIGLGVAAAAAAAGIGVVAERATRGRDLTTGTIDLREAPRGRQTVAIADDGIPLNVIIDEPEGGAPQGSPTIVLTHGYCLNLDMWTLQRRALAEAGHRIVLWDQRSHGDSGHASKDSCTLDQLGRDLRRVLDEHAPDGPLVLIGHSMGGMTQMAYAREFPEEFAERVVAVGLLGTSAGGTAMMTLGFGPMVGSLVGRVGPDVLWRLGRYQDRLDPLRRFGRGVEDAVVARYAFGSPMSREATRFVGDMIFRTPFSVMADFLPALEGVDERDSLRHFVGIDCLVVNGEADLITPPEHSEAIVQRVPGAEHVVIRDAGHLLMLEHPDVVNEQLLDLVDRGARAARHGMSPTEKPRVRRLVTDMTRVKRPRSGGGSARSQRGTGKGATGRPSGKRAPGAASGGSSAEATG